MLDAIKMVCDTLFLVTEDREAKQNNSVGAKHCRMGVRKEYIEEVGEEESERERDETSQREGERERGMFHILRMNVFKPLPTLTVTGKWFPGPHISSCSNTH